ncbi:MAG: HEAT repeat domain-containing protein [Planctomycetota bacterium]|jgi:HEAT repeat protein
MPRSALALTLAAALALAGLAWLTLGGDDSTGEPPPEDPTAPGESGSGSTGPGAGGPLEVSPEPPDVLETLLGRLEAPGELPQEEELLPLAGSEEGVDRLLALLASSGDTERKAVVLQVLARSPLSRAQAAVVRAAKGDSGRELRSAGILALAVADEETALPVLCEIATHETDLMLAGTAYQALAYRNTARAQTALLEALQSAPGAQRKILIYLAMAGEQPTGGPEDSDVVRKIRQKRTSFVVPHPELIEPYQEFLDRASAESDPEVSMAAATALSRMQGPGTADAFVKVIESAKGPMQVALVSRLDPRQSPSHYEGLVGLAPSVENAECRSAIAERLSECEDPEIVPELREWGDRERDEAIRGRVKAAIRRLEKMK